MIIAVEVIEADNPRSLGIAVNRFIGNIKTDREVDNIQYQADGQTFSALLVLKYRRQ